MSFIPKPHEIYKHFKGNLYQITAIAEHTETGETLVVYQAMYGDFKTYARPLSMFISPVDREKYPDSAQEFRFELQGPEAARQKAEAGVHDRAASRESQYEAQARVTVAAETSLQGNPKAVETSSQESRESAGVSLQGSQKVADTSVQEDRELAASPQGEGKASGGAGQNPADAGGGSAQELSGPESAETEEDSGEFHIDPLVLEFLDADSYEQRLNILAGLHHRITDEMITTMAIACDLEVGSGDIEERYESLKTCLVTMERYECNRLR